MKSFNIVQMENGVLLQIAQQPNQILKSLVFEGEDHFARLVDAIDKEMHAPAELTVAKN
jgi:hypothetical protein